MMSSKKVSSLTSICAAFSAPGLMDLLVQGVPKGIIRFDRQASSAAERLGRHPFRPAHLHFILSRDGYDEVTTHIFDPEDPYLESDAVFGVKETLIATFNKVEDQPV